LPRRVKDLPAEARDFAEFPLMLGCQRDTTDG
jgi:hypothetical protein